MTASERSTTASGKPRKARATYTPAEKVAVLRRHLIEKVPVSDLCDELGLSPNLFYLWQKTFFEQGAAAFERAGRKSKSSEDAKDRLIAALQLRMASKNEVISELMEENVRSKKELGEL
jgi:transposase-like protein